ncbi:MAG: c-type cytochrome [Solirubrobacterales bacterium]|nr:c-type cytochrome [Solirubrobacterales bacterium]
MPRATRPRTVAHLVLSAGAVSAALGLSACSVKERDADQIAGKQAFVQKCGSCHILNRAGTKGVTGPNLDAAFGPSLDDGLGRGGVRGVVRKQIDFPSQRGSTGTGTMPADLAEGSEADDIASYVAAVVSKKGEDQGLLGSAVEKAGGGEPYVAEGGTLTIVADPGGGLIYTADAASAEAGALKVVMENDSGVPHNVVIDQKGETDVIEQGTTDFTADFSPDTYAFYCSVTGHREAGMEGTLTVK